MVAGSVLDTDWFDAVAAVPAPYFFVSGAGVVVCGGAVVVVTVVVVGSGVDVTVVVEGSVVVEGAVVVGVAESWTLNVASAEKLAVAVKPPPTGGSAGIAGGGSGALVPESVESAGGWAVSAPATSLGAGASWGVPAGGIAADTEVRVRAALRSKAGAVGCPELSARGGPGSGPARIVVPIAVTTTAITKPGTCRRN